MSHHRRTQDKQLRLNIGSVLSLFGACRSAELRAFLNLEQFYNCEDDIAY